MKRKNVKTELIVALAVLLSVLWIEPAVAYIGPGAGFAFLSSFFVLFAGVAIAVVVILTAPFRFLIRLARGGWRRKGNYDRVVIVGLDGLDPALASEMMDAGELPNLNALRANGSFSTLKTTCPPISPVAWSSFMTGVSPARHNIYDFIAPERKTYFPILSSSEIKPTARVLRLGGFAVPLGKPVISLKRKSRAFWDILSDHGISSTILRVPITFPPERFGGRSLSGMCVPDLRGTQGVFSFYTSAGSRSGTPEGGETVNVQVINRTVKSRIVGPKNTLRKGAGAIELPFSISWEGGASEAAIVIKGAKTVLKVKRWSDWMKLRFHAGPGVNIYGICRFYLKSLEPDFELYVSPINIDPERPALPISHPLIYSIYLSKKLGDFSTLGLAEDTWALNERVLDEAAFLEQCWSNHGEREKMFFHELARVRRGVCACVFDTTDRIQHAFWRYHRRCEHQPLDNYDVYKDTVRDLYRRMDGLIGRVMHEINERDALIVMSDHGFKSFRRGVDLNAWLEKEGYLVRREGAVGAEWLGDVDWSRTRAYAIGLAGLYLNMKGREGAGIVDPSAASALRAEIASKLNGLKDEAAGEVAVNAIYDLNRLLSGPYLDQAPDLVVGYNDGYRTSWGCAVGKIGNCIFEDNTKSWSGDHCVDPEIVPGAFFSNLRINGNTPSMMDIAPSVLSLFGVPAPPYMEGKSLFSAGDG